MWELHTWLKSKSPVDLDRHLPLMLFDDAGVTGKSSSAYVRVFYSLVGKGSDRETRIIMGTNHKIPSNQEDESWGPILDSFEQLAEAVGPNEWGGVLLFMGSDLEYICNEVGMAHYNSNELCGYCLADGDSRPHTDNSAGAMWRHSVLNNVQFLARFRHPPHPLVNHKWFSLYSYRMDLMHIATHDSRRPRRSSRTT